MCSAFRWARQPAGRNVHSPAPSWRTRPARTISLCDSASASAGACFSVGSREGDRGATPRKPIFLPPARTLDKEPAMAYEVPPLPYEYDALEPHIDKATME